MHGELTLIKALTIFGISVYLIEIFALMWCAWSIYKSYVAIPAKIIERSKDMILLESDQKLFTDFILECGTGHKDDAMNMLIFRELGMLAVMVPMYLHGMSLWFLPVLIISTAWSLKKHYRTARVSAKARNELKLG